VAASAPAAIAAPAPPRGGLRAAWVALRNRLLMSADFQRWAAWFPLTRPLVAARANALFDVVVGFVYAKVAAACVEFGLLERLAQGPASEATLAAELGLAPAAADALFKAAIALGLLERLGAGRLALGPQGAALLGSAGVRDMIAHHALLYQDLADPVAFLRRSGRGRVAGYWAYAGSDAPGEAAAQDVSAYSALMTRSQPMVSAQVLAAYPFARARHILDIGGGEAAFAIAVARAAPHARLTMFDLPAVAARARAHIADAGLGGRIAAVGGDFHTDPLPAGADLITCVRVVHDHDDAEALALLRAARRAAPPGGRIIVAEQMAGGSAVSDAFFNLYLLSMGQGRARTPREVAALLEAAGFENPRRISPPTPLIVDIVEARARG